MKIFQASRLAWQAFKTVYTSTTLHLSNWWRGLQAEWGDVTYDALATRAYRNPTSARALRLVSQLAASIPFVVRLPGAGDDGEMTSDHEMLQLLRRPNPRTSTGVLMDKLVAHLYCGGELFVRKIAPDTGPNRGKPTASGGGLHLLSPSTFKEFIRDGAGTITGYRFSRHPLGLGPELVLTTEECLHIRIYNPLDEERGLPLLVGAHRALEQTEAADDWNKAVAQGGGRLPGWFTPRLENGQQLTPDQVAEAQAIADDAVQERRNKYLPMVLSGAFDFQEASMSLKDADYLKGNQQQSRHIATVIGISPTLLGDEKSGQLTDAGIDSEVRAAYLLTVIPLMEFVLGELNAWLSPSYGGAELTYDRDQIEALNEDVNEIFKRYALACGGPWLTADEAREANGYQPLGGAAGKLRRSAELEVGGRPVNDGDTDGEAGEGQADDVGSTRSVAATVGAAALLTRPGRPAVLDSVRDELRRLHAARN